MNDQDHQPGGKYWTRYSATYLTKAGGAEKYVWCNDCFWTRGGRTFLHPDLKEQHDKIAHPIEVI